MAKTLGAVGKIAGTAAAVSSVLLGPGNPVTLALTAVAAVATVGSQILAKPPPVRGSVAQLQIAPDPPQPYMMGEGYSGGVLRHDAAYGATLNDVPNPYRGLVVTYSGGGPVQSIAPQVDKDSVTAWYSTYLYTDTQLGATPEASALSPNFAGLPGWDASSKLNGQAAILWNLKFDKKGKRFASGVPIIGAYGQWVKAYDPRLDSTFPGGSGSHILGDESTYTWTENPALHFGTYAYGRYQNGKRTFGCGLTSIDWGVIAAWANVCDANAWTIFGVIYEPGNRWDNLKDIAAAGGAVPVVSSGGRLSVKYWAPVVALDTITAADIAEGQVQYSPLQSWDDRVNTVIPRYTSADHEWNQVAAEPVSIAGFVTEDGEEKRKEWPYNLVKDPEQAAQLAAYQIYEGREVNPIVIPCLPRLRAYRPGECLTLDLPDYGLEMDAIILNRTLDPATLTVTLTLIGETPAKHAAALGQAPAPPVSPVTGQDGEDRDDTSAGAGSPTTTIVANDAAMLALNVPAGILRVGTRVKVTATGLVYEYNGGIAGTLADWTLIATTIGASDGDKGDITVTGSGLTWTIDNAVVTLAKMANMATASLIYRKTAGTGAPEVNTLATLKTDLGLTGTNSGDQTTIVGISGTTAQFNTALSDGDFATLAGSETLTNKSLTAAVLTGTTVAARIDASAHVNSANAFRSTGFSVLGGWAGPGFEMGYSSGLAAAFVQGHNRTSNTAIPVHLYGSSILLAANTDTTGEMRCDTLRIDGTATAATPVTTHTFPVNINGTIYRVPCVI